MFLLFYPSVSGTRKRVGAAPKTRSCFSGGTGTGVPEPEGYRRQSRSFAGAGRRKSPEAVPRQKVGQETDREHRTSFVAIGQSAGQRGERWSSEFYAGTDAGRQTKPRETSASWPALSAWARN